jgi:hypothetical protein
MIDLPLPDEMVLFPELTSLCTLETALEMSACALYLSCPEITASKATTAHQPDLLAAAAVLRSIRALQRDLRTYRRALGLAVPGAQLSTLVGRDSAGTGEQSARNVADGEREQDRSTF